MAGKKDLHFPPELRYTAEDEWVRVEGGEAVVGITDYAQDQLGDIVYVEFRVGNDELRVGSRVEQGKPFGTIESVKATADLFSPVTGEVVAINDQLFDRLELINQSPYERGWMIRVRLDDPAEVDKLMTADQYKQKVS
jgi:glycine cleavage system H protein